MLLETDKDSEAIEKFVKDFMLDCKARVNGDDGKEKAFMMFVIELTVTDIPEIIEAANVKVVCKDVEKVLDACDIESSVDDKLLERVVRSCKLVTNALEKEVKISDSDGSADNCDVCISEDSV